MTDSPSFLGAIIAGGGSERFGAPKAQTRIAGLPMIEWPRRALTSAAHVAVVGGDPAVAEALGVEHLVDAAPGGGPLAGLVAALESARARGLDGVFALACDVPLVTPGLVREVMRGARAHDVVAASGPLGPEPLCAFYGTSCLEVARAHLASENLSLKGLLDDLPVHVIEVEAGGPAGASDLFVNVNTPEDARRADEALAARAKRASASDGPAQS